MGYSTRPYASSGYSRFFPTAVKWLLISNIALFVLNYFAVLSGFGRFFEPFALVPADVLTRGAFWQLVTYMFLHAPFDFWHILFNMLALWMFGMDLEKDWGTRRFLQYYFLCGVGAGLCVVIANILFSSNWNSRTIGASGAIYGLLMAFGLMYPDRTVFFSFLFPIKAKYFVMIMGAIAFMSSFGPSGGGVSHIAHLGGMIFGYGYLRRWRSRRRPGGGVRAKLNPLAQAKQWYREYRFKRAKRKFEVYLRKKGSDRDRWVH